MRPIVTKRLLLKILQRGQWSRAGHITCLMFRRGDSNEVALSRDGDDDRTLRKLCEYSGLL